MSDRDIRKGITQLLATQDADALSREQKLAVLRLLSSHHGIRFECITRDIHDTDMNYLASTDFDVLNGVYESLAALNRDLESYLLPLNEWGQVEVIVTPREPDGSLRRHPNGTIAAIELGYDEYEITITEDENGHIDPNGDFEVYYRARLEHVFFFDFDLERGDAQWI